MDELQLRSRSVSELVDAAFALYRRDAGQYMILVAIAHVPTLLAKLLLPNVNLTTVTAANPASLGTYFWSTMLTLLASVLTYAFASAAVMKFGSDVYLGERADIETTISHVLPRLASMMFSNVLKGFLYFLGLLCFLVGAFYVAARWFAVQAVIVLEDKGAFGSFERSSELSEGRKRHILNTILLVGIIYGLLSIGVGLFASMVKSEVVTIAVSTVYTIVAMPVVALTAMVLYYDCRIRGEGFDLERMSASMDRAAPGAEGAAS